MKALAAIVLMLVFVAPASLGGDPGISDRELFDAAERGDLSAVEALLAAGADPNDRMDGFPVLQLAVWNGTVQVIEALLAAGADVNAFGEWVPGCCPFQATALHEAVRYWSVCSDRDLERCAERRAAVIRVLLAAGADLDARDKVYGRTPLELAESYGFTEVMDILAGAGAPPG